MRGRLGDPALGGELLLTWKGNGGMVMWSMEWIEGSLHGVWSVECEVGSVECEVGNVEYMERVGGSVECGVGSAKWGVWNVVCRM